MWAKALTRFCVGRRVTTRFCMGRRAYALLSGQTCFLFHRFSSVKHSVSVDALPLPLVILRIALCVDVGELVASSGSKPILLLVLRQVYSVLSLCALRSCVFVGSWQLTRACYLGYVCFLRFLACKFDTSVILGLFRAWSVIHAYSKPLSILSFLLSSSGCYCRFSAHASGLKVVSHPCCGQGALALSICK